MSSSPTELSSQSINSNCWRIYFRQFVKTLVVGAGFLADAYDLFVINVIILILRSVYKEDVAGEDAVATAALVGAIAGQLLFGVLADRIGRRIGFLITLSFVTLGAIFSGSSIRLGSLSIFTVLAASRFILGFGIGGEYPLSATISSENANTARRGSSTALVFSMQGIGMLCAPVLALFFLMTHISLDIVWRILLFIGAIPGIVMFYFRYRMKETSRFTRQTSARTSIIQTLQTIRLYSRELCATAGAWFLFDVTFYANGLFSSVIIEEMNLIGEKPPENAPIDVIRENLIAVTKIDCYLVLIGIPGYYVAVALIDRIGRRKLQLIGFAMLAALYTLIAAGLGWLKQSVTGFFVVYGFTFFFSQFSNTTTFVLPSELFPTSVRATCHGLSAATGKLGAALGGAILRPLLDSSGLPVVMYCCASVAIIGFILTYVLTPETLGKSLEELEYARSNLNDAQYNRFFTSSTQEHHQETQPLGTLSSDEESNWNSIFKEDKSESMKDDR